MIKTKCLYELSEEKYSLSIFKFRNKIYNYISEHFKECKTDVDFFKKLNDKSLKRMSNNIYKKHGSKIEQCFNCADNDVIDSISAEIEFKILSEYLGFNYNIDDIYEKSKGIYTQQYSLDELPTKYSVVPPNGVIALPGKTSSEEEKCDAKKSCYDTSDSTSSSNDLINYEPLPTIDKANLNDSSLSGSIMLKDFVLSDKTVFPFSMGTSFGKSYSFRRFAPDLFLDEKINKNINKAYYIVDTNANLENECNDFIKMNGHLGLTVCKVMSNVNCIIKHQKEFEDLPFCFQNLESYKKVKDILSFNNGKNPGAFADILSGPESDFRKEVKNLLKNKLSDKLNIKPDNIDISFLEQIKADSELSKILKVYTNYKILESDVVFINLSSFTSDIDILLDKINISKDEEFIKNSFFDFDEADALCDSLYSSISENAKMLPDLYGTIKRINNNINTNAKILFSDNKSLDTLNAKITNFNDIFNSIKLPCDLIKVDTRLSETFKSDCFLFKKANEPIININDKKNYVLIVGTNKEVILIDKKDVPDKKYIICDYNFFISRLLDCYTEVLHILHLMSQMYRSKIGSTKMTLEKAIGVIVKCFVLDNIDNSEIQKIFSNSILNIIDDKKRPDPAEDKTDVFLAPIMISGIDYNVLNDPSARFNAIFINETPEKFLYRLILLGGKVVLSSATINVDTKMRNFNLKWDKIKNSVYKIDEEKELKLFEIHKKNKEKNIDKIKNEIIKVGEDIKKEKDFLKNRLDKNDNFVEGICNKLLSDSDEYRVERYITMFYSICLAIEKDSHINYIINKFNMANKGAAKIAIEEMFERIKKYYKKHFDFNVAIICSYNSKDYNSSFNEFKKSNEVIDQMSNKNFGFFITCNTNGGKAVNPSVKIKTRKSKLVHFSFLEDDFEEKHPSSKIEVEVDPCGLFIGQHTCALPRSKYNQKISDSINTILRIGPLYAMGFISEDIYKEKIKESLQKNINFSGTEVKDIFNYCEAAIITTAITQNIGRLPRSHYHFKNNLIMIDNYNFERLSKDYRLNDFFSKTDIAMQPSIVSDVFNEIFQKPASLNPEKLNISENTNANQLNLMDRARKANDKDGILEYNKNRQVKFLCLTEEEYLLQTDTIRKYYFRSPFSEYKYSYSCEKCIDGVKRRFTEFGKYGTYDVNVNPQNLNYPDTIIKMLEEKYGFDFDITKDYKYILTPIGFDLFKGYSGECIAKTFLETVSASVIKDMPTILTERTDFIWENSGNAIFVDAKSYSVHDKIYDDIKLNEGKFHKKLKFLYKEYRKKCTIIVLNTRNVGPGFKIGENIGKFEEGNIITVPNIYDNDGNFDLNILLELIEITNSIAEE